MWVSGFDKAGERDFEGSGSRKRAVQVLKFAVKLISFTVMKRLNATPISRTCPTAIIKLRPPARASLMTCSELQIN